jgi:hypothetical protein
MRLPVIQYTAYKIRSGLLSWAFAQQRSVSANAVFAARIHTLHRYGVSLRDLVWQADHSDEFRGDFPKALSDNSTSVSHPPRTPIRAMWRSCTASKKTNSLIWKNFSSRGDFLAKVHTYQLSFNLLRPKSHL